jgi:hypothetical protein
VQFLLQFPWPSNLYLFPLPLFAAILLFYHLVFRLLLLSQVSVANQESDSKAEKEQMDEALAVKK